MEKIKETHHVQGQCTMSWHVNVDTQTASNDKGIIVHFTGNVDAGYLGLIKNDTQISPLQPWDAGKLINSFNLFYLSLFYQ